LEVAWDAHPGRSLRHLLPPINLSSARLACLTALT